MSDTGVYRDGYDGEDQQPIVQSKGLEIKDKEAMTDTYDLLDMVTNVHSKVPELNKDFTMSDLREEIIDGKLTKFIREQLKILRIMESYLVVDKNVLMRRNFTEEEAKLIRARLNTTYERIHKLITTEFYSMVVMSRAFGGRILKAVLLHSRRPEEIEEFERDESSDKREQARERDRNDRR